jgi:hypothetical protein
MPGGDRPAVTATAHRWAGGWELVIDEDNVTQVEELADARQQVVDHLDTIDPSTDHSGVNVEIIPDRGEAFERSVDAIIDKHGDTLNCLKDR